jgi:hypothetical protein
MAVKIKIYEVTKIADINTGFVSAKLKQSLIGKHTFLDTKESLREHLYSPSSILENHHTGDEDEQLPPDVVDELENIREACDKKDCAYFRIISM